MGLFKKALVFTDIHFGMKSNSIMHNQDCEQFVDWQWNKANCTAAKLVSLWEIGITIEQALAC